MALEALPDGGPRDLDRIRAEFVGLSPCEVDVHLADYLHQWHQLRDMLAHLSDMASDAEHYMELPVCYNENDGF